MNSEFRMLSLGPGLRLTPVEDIHRAFAPFGMSIRGFRAWLRALGVSVIYMPGADMIDVLDLQLAFRVLKRVTRGPIYLPGCSQIRRGEASPTTLTAADFEAHWRDAISELLLARNIDYDLAPFEFREQLDKAAQRIALALSQLTSNTLSASIARVDVASVVKPSETQPCPTSSESLAPPD
mgnify:CR=1 FL=1